MEFIISWGGGSGSMEFTNILGEVEEGVAALNSLILGRWRREWQH